MSDGQNSETYFEISIPTTIIVRVSPDALCIEEGQSTDDALLAYIADLVKSPSQRDSDRYDTEIDETHIEVDEYLPPVPRVNPLPQRVGVTRTVKVAQEKVTYAWGTVWAYVGRFVTEKVEAGL